MGKPLKLIRLERTELIKLIRIRSSDRDHNAIVFRDGGAPIYIFRFNNSVHNNDIPRICITVRCKVAYYDESGL